MAGDPPDTRRTTDQALPDRERERVAFHGLDAVATRAGLNRDTIARAVAGDALMLTTVLIISTAVAQLDRGAKDRITQAVNHRNDRVLTPVQRVSILRHGIDSVAQRAQLARGTIVRALAGARLLRCSALAITAALAQLDGAT